MEPYTYIASSIIRAGKLKTYLPVQPAYTISIEKGEKEKCILLDTFENDLQKNSLLLLQLGTHLSLVNFKTGRTIHQEGKPGWRFARELDKGRIASVLGKVSKLRAYLPVEELSFKIDLGLLLDDEDKTRARFQNLVLYGKNKTITVGTTQYLRGYDKAHADLIEIFHKFGGAAVKDSPDLYTALGIKRKNYNPKPQITLHDDAPAIESGIEIIKAFMAVARANEAGIIADTDTEFLHDYRVNFRKVRSVLSLFKGIFYENLTRQLKEEFAELMQQTNRLRDLDVYLLEREKYFDLIPSMSHAGVAVLFEYLEKERAAELIKVTKNLKSKKYKNQLKTLEMPFSDTNKILPGPNGTQPSKQFAARMILKRYHQVCKIAQSIDQNTEDCIVHRLRISCKKLRYLMEFFASLFPENEIKSLIKPLKILQDNLGKFNDYSVQQAFLHQIIKNDLAAFGEKEILVTESIGALTAMLFRLQGKERKQVMKNFSRFDSLKTRNLFKQLFTNVEAN